jgi:hypothetical protein
MLFHVAVGILFFSSPYPCQLINPLTLSPFLSLSIFNSELQVEALHVVTKWERAGSTKKTAKTYFRFLFSWEIFKV